MSTAGDGRIRRSIDGDIRFWLAEHPSIVNFRWSHSQSWGSTWYFLVVSIAAYVSLALLLHVSLLLFRRRRPVPLGPIPAIHNLAMAVISAAIFSGILLSAEAEIRETRWFWRRSKTPLQWLLCFPIGTRPTGRVFFWSYAFYLSRFLEMPRSFFSILRRRSLAASQLLNRSVLVCTSFLWLEFSQSFQVVAILSTTLVCSVVYGYRFWVEVGLPPVGFPIVTTCRMLLLGCNLLCHLGVLLLHLRKGGCNGIGAWVFNSVTNATLLMLCLNFYVKSHIQRRNAAPVAGDKHE